MKHNPQGDPIYFLSIAQPFLELLEKLGCSENEDIEEEDFWDIDKDASEIEEDDDYDYEQYDKDEEEFEWKWEDGELEDWDPDEEDWQ